MEFQVLGRLGARSGGDEVPLGSFKQRSLLALLLVHANEVVSTDRIIDELWGGDTAVDRQNALWVHVSNLRSALEPDREKGSPGSVLVTQAPGYRLQVAPGDLDAWEFERLVREGRTLLETDPAATSMVVGEGLALWQGRPYEDLAYETFAQPEIARLEELRLEAVELRIEADLRQGRSAESIAELEGLVRQHPLRERFAAQLMLALHRSGRQADALRAYARLRAELGTELGLEPSAGLRELEERILLDDPSLAVRHGAIGAEGRLAVRGYEVRDQIGEGSVGPVYRAYQPAVGREVALKVIRSDLADDPAFIRRFEAEAERVARLEHHHIVPLYDYWREPGAAYLVMRLLRGGNLADAIDDGPMPPVDAARLVHEVGSALAFAHRHGVVHGGIKPSNILLDDEGRSYLSDFGVATEASSDTTTTYAAPEQRRGAPATVASDVYSLAVVLHHALTATDDDRATVDGELPAAVAAVLARATATDPAARPHDSSAFVASVVTALGAGRGDFEATAIDNPYKGLHAFGEADAADFFGRERVVERLIARLGEGGTRARFVALVGPSGSGKSSVVKAGLLPALRAGAAPGSAGWFFVDMIPGASPFEALEAALLRLAVEPPIGLLDTLTGGPTGLARAVRNLSGVEGAQLVLVIDQLEELFTLAPAETGHAFLDALAVAVDDPHTGVRVVTTLRADFYDRPLRHHRIGELLRRGTEVLTPLSPEEVERSILGPAERAGVRFDAGLVAEIVADVAEHPGALPLLQYALTELFDRRRGQLIERAAYRELGGIAAALVRRAEILYDELEPPARDTARQVLLRLVALGDSGEVSRRRVLRRELEALGDPATDMVLETLGAHRLLAFDRDPATRGPTIEVAHEALLTEWDRLRNWIEAGRDDLRQQRRLAADAAEWHRSAGDADYLLHGSRLAQVSAWAAGTGIALGPEEREFLDVSMARHDEQVAAEEQRRQREELLHRRTLKRTRQLVGAGLVLALVAGLAAFGFVQRNDAERLADQVAAASEANRLAASSLTVSEIDPDVAMFLALLSLDKSADAGLPALPESEEALHWAIQGARIPYPVRDAPSESRVGPNGLTGIYDLPLADLVAIARDHLEDHPLAQHDCEEFGVVCRTSASDVGSLDTPAEPVELTPFAFPSLGGTTVTISGTRELSPGLRAELDRFRAETRIEVVYRTAEREQLAGALVRGEVPDLMLLSPDSLQQFAAAGQLLDLGAYLDLTDVRDQIGDHLVELTSRGSAYHGVPFDLELKSLVWYPVPEFVAAGYPTPTSWPDLDALADRLVADGRTPWCLGLETGVADGWPATDWIESLVLRIGGTDLYDRWTTHEIGFDDPAIREAADRFGEVAFGEGYVEGGAPAVAERDLFDAVDAMLEDPPRCWLHHLASFLPLQVEGGLQPGVDFDYFVLPPLEGAAAPPMLGGGTMAGVLTDRPEVRQFVQWLLSPRWGTVWAGAPGETFLSPNIAFDTAHCATPQGDQRVNAVRVRLCEDNRAAIAADRWRYDASDVMPAAVGGTTASSHGAFLTGMLEYTQRQPDAASEVLARIEAAWPAPGGD